MMPRSKSMPGVLKRKLELRAPTRKSATMMIAKLNPGISLPAMVEMIGWSRPSMV